jgi:uncharacterized protein (DUF1778 family)
VNLRIAPVVKANLLKAAKASGCSLTDFVIASAVASADDILAARRSFPLAPEQWQKFNELLDAPARDIPQLKALLRKKSIFE